MSLDSSTFKRAIHAEGESLRESYPDVTDHQVEVAHANWKAGKTAGDIVEMFAFDHFAAYPHLFGEQRAAPVPAARNTTELDPFEKNDTDQPHGRTRQSR